MKYEITKEQILETIRTGTDVTERYFKEIIPEAFNTKLDTGKWYKSSADIEFLVCYQSNGFDNYGFWRDQPYRDNLLFGDCWYNMSRLATDEEVSAALINEAKKRGYKDGVTITWKNKPKLIYTLGDDEFDYLISKNVLVFGNYGIFDGEQWAEILPQEKTVISM